MPARVISSTIAGFPVSLRQLGGGFCWGMKFGKSLFLSHVTIDSQEKAKSWLKAAKELQGQPTLRISVEQLGLPENDWDRITTEHIFLAWLASQEGLSLQVAHLNLPMRPLYTPKEELPPSEFLLRSIAKLPKLQNIDAWEIYCYWLHEVMERILETFHLESMDVYTLQALLLGFVREVRATLLMSEEADVTETLLQLGGVRGLLEKKTEAESISLEKILVKRRGEEHEELTVQCETLSKIVPVIEAIEQSHRELGPLKWQASILQHLLGPQLDLATPLPIGWIERLILLQLIHEELGIVTSVSADERAWVAFAVQLATAILREKHSLEELLDMALHWSKLVAGLDKAFLEHGVGFEKYLNQKENLAEQFRQIVVDVLERLCVPAASGKPLAFRWHESQKASDEILDLFPTKMARAGSPKTLAPTAHQLLFKLFQKKA